mmetsp:Transcript_14957/g.22510  ORF Transcript_14957/g.22510 Transcript_14957/m.22510 type:complete len:127 (+) Transcript_14957:74-454(+)
MADVLDAESDDDENVVTEDVVIRRELRTEGYRVGIKTGRDQGLQRGFERGFVDTLSQSVTAGYAIGAAEALLFLSSCENEVMSNAIIEARKTLKCSKPLEALKLLRPFFSARQEDSLEIMRKVQVG